MSVEGEGHIGGHEDCRPVGIAANSSNSTSTKYLCEMLLADDDEVSECCVNFFVMTEGVRRTLIENEEYLSRRCVTSDFRKGCAILSGCVSLQGSSMPIGTGVSIDGDERTSYGLISAEPFSDLCGAVGSPFNEQCGTLSGVCCAGVCCRTDLPCFSGGYDSSKAAVYVSGVKVSDQCKEPLLVVGEGLSGASGGRLVASTSYGTLDETSWTCISRYGGTTATSSVRFCEYSKELPVFVDGDILTCSCCGKDVEFASYCRDGACCLEVPLSESNRAVGVRCAIFNVFAFFIVCVLMMHVEAWSSLRVANVSDDFFGGKYAATKVMSVNAAAVGLMFVVALACFTSVLETPNVALLASTVLLVVNDFCLLYGVAWSGTSYLVLCEVLEAAGFVGSFVSLLLLSCSDAGRVYGPPFIALLVCQLWLAARLLPTAVAPSSVTGVTSYNLFVVHGVFAVVFLTLAAGVCFLRPASTLQPAACSCGKFPHATDFFSCVRRFNPSFFIRSAACGCLVAVGCLLTVDCGAVPPRVPGNTFPVWAGDAGGLTDRESGSDVWPGSAVLLILGTAASLLLCIVPRMGAFVRFLELGPASITAVLTTAVLFDGRSLTVVLAVVCGLSSGVAIGGLLRSMIAVSVHRGAVHRSLGKAVTETSVATVLIVTPVILVAGACTICVALALGISSWLQAFCRTVNDSGSSVAPRGGHRRVVLFTALVFSSMALALQVVAGTWGWLPRLYKRVAGIA